MATTSASQKQTASDSTDHRHFLIRSPSASSDVTTRSIVNFSVPSANPISAYVAQKAASELVSTEIDRTVLVSSSALTLINEFLDQVLYNILLTSRSTSLGSLKAAVPSVLKPRLGKAALRVAEEELKEYLDDDEEIELHTKPSTTELKHDFEPDLAWKLARLRCMVYTRLGDLEEEDEEEWLEKDGLRMQLEAARQSSRASMETGPASAIFLTSIIEYLGEQALYYAAQHAQKRHSQQGDHRTQEDEADLTELAPGPDDIVIGGKDMNHVGRDSPLSRLWRSYRRNTRESSSRPMSPEFRGSRGFSISHSRTSSSIPHGTVILEDSRSPDQIPLPISGNDINEIEVPGLAPAFSDDENEPLEDASPQKKRPASMIIMPSAQAGSLDLDEEDDDARPPEIPERSPLRPNWLRKRSISSPVPTLGKPTPLDPGTERRTEQPLRSGSSATARRSPPAIGQRRSSSVGVEASSRNSAGVFGGAVAAVAGVLGMGTLGISQSREQPSDSSYAESNRNDTSTPTIVPPKKTVAEEMLGSRPSVAPPKDAQTGSSITNVSDFYSMHVPVAASPGSQLSQGSLTPLAPTNDEYFPTNKSVQHRASHGQHVGLGQTDGTSDSYGKLRPSPLRTTSDRTAPAKPSTTAGRDASDSALGQDVSSIPPKTPDTETPVSAVTQSDSRPESSSSAFLATAVSAIPRKGTLRDSSQVQHTKTDSHGSVDSPYAGNLSNGNKLPGLTRDGSRRSQAASQSVAAGASSEETKVVHSSPNINASRDIRPGTGNSSVNKRFLAKPVQLGDESDEAKKKSLEILIRGNETLHYTLTPAAALRDEQSMTQRNRNEPQDRADFRNTGSLAQETNIRSKSSGLSSNVADPPKSPGLVQRVVTPSSPRGVVTPVSPSRAKNPLGEPRDARTDSVPSTRDLADYARSTGPMDTKQLPQSLGPKATSATPPRLASATPRSDVVPRDPIASSSGKPANRLKHQARDPRPFRTNDTSELIDFIREGPPNPAREHRIDRKVAPFRSTMDSEDFNNLAGGREMIASFRGSEDSHPTPSVDPSITSQTPLIVSNGIGSRATMPATTLVQNSAEPEDGPKRTRRRIKDPYAIYDSDDEDDLDEMTSKQPRGQEESLIEFLRNTAPPPDMTTQPILTSRTNQLSAEHLKASGARASSPHLTQSGTKLDKYRPTQPTHAPHVDRNRAGMPTRASEPNLNRPKPRFEARDAKATRTDTSELAQYLRNSGPAPNAEFKPQPFILSTASPPPPPKTPALPAKEEKSIFKRFSKNKK